MTLTESNKRAYIYKDRLFIESVDNLLKIEMSRLRIKFDDLPTELLILIFKEMTNVEVLYSFFGINDRLDSISQDSVLIKHLNFLSWSSGKFLNIFSSDIVFERFCSQILPAIHKKIQWLDVDSSSAKEILCAADYSNLHGLSLFNIEDETIRNLFTGKRKSQDLVSLYNYFYV
jgi:hypothetical protein